MNVAKLLVILLWLPPYYADEEAPEAREARLGRVAVAIHSAGASLTCAAADAEDDCRPKWRRSRTELELLLLTQGFWESRYARHVHRGNCLPHECDEGRARSPWQLQRGGHLGPEVWLKINDDTQGATSLAALHAGIALSRAYSRCRTVPGAVSMYATGKRCTWSGTAERLSWLKRVRARWGL